jgi:hypothetical protein
VVDGPQQFDVERWSAEERAYVARLLDGMIDRPSPGGRAPMLRVLVIAVTLVGAVVLLPWIAFLSASLPRTHSVQAWRLVWVGFDIGLAIVLGVTGWWVLRRRQVAVLGLAVTTTLLVCDAWFDVCLAWHTGEQAWALASAALVELPVAALTGAGAVRLLERSGAVVRQLRGQAEPPRSVWREELVMVPPDRAG